MKETWKSIELFLANAAPELKENLNDGVSDEEVLHLEKTIGTKLPVEFIEFYKVHNGQSSDSAGLMDCEELLSFERMLDEWGKWQYLLDNKMLEDDNGLYTSTPDNGVKNNWWNPLWLPLTYDGSGNHYCLDLDPAVGGIYGQVIRMWHDDPSRSLVANSFAEWITDFNNKINSGQLIYSEDDFGLVDKDTVE
jgi:cell wall assembly regulator SMI1